MAKLNLSIKLAYNKVFRFVFHFTKINRNLKAFRYHYDRYMIKW